MPQKFWQTSFSQRHKIGNIAIVANLLFLIYLQFPFLFVSNDFGKCEMRILVGKEEYIFKFTEFISLVPF